MSILKIVFITFIISLSGLAKTTLILSVGSHYSEPFVIRNSENKIISGILHDFFELFCKENNCKVEYREIPRKRIEDFILGGKTHILARANPAWLKKSKEMQWSETWLIGKNNFFYNAKKYPAFKIPNSLEAKKVGMVTGYYYPGLKGISNYVRDDANSLEKNLLRFKNDWIDIVYGSKRNIDYMSKKNKIEDVKEADYKGYEFEIKMAISKESPFNVNQINSFIKKIKKDKTLNQILNKY